MELFSFKWLNDFLYNPACWSTLKCLRRGILRHNQGSEPWGARLWFHTYSMHTCNHVCRPAWGFTRPFSFQSATEFESNTKHQPSTSTQMLSFEYTYTFIVRRSQHMQSHTHIKLPSPFFSSGVFLLLPIHSWMKWSILCCVDGYLPKLDSGWQVLMPWSVY